MRSYFFGVIIRYLDRFCAARHRFDGCNQSPSLLLKYAGSVEIIVQQMNFEQQSKLEFLSITWQIDKIRRHTESQWLGSHFYFLWNIPSSHPEFVEYTKITFTLSKQSVWAQSSQRRHRVRLLLLLHVITIITQPSSERERANGGITGIARYSNWPVNLPVSLWVSLTGNMPCNTICVVHSLAEHYRKKHSCDEI